MPTSAKGHRVREGVSFVIPVYNEEQILESTVEEMVCRIAERMPDRPREVILIENGSRDRSPEVVRALADRYPEVRGWSLDRPSYGSALRSGILQAGHDRIVVFNADFWSVEFAVRAVELLDRHDVVVGSKRAKGARDERGVKRRLVTSAFNGFLRLVFRFRGTDTHGLKAIRGGAMREIAAACVTDREIFDTEMILRAQRSGLDVVELPVSVRESRPTRYGLMSRVPSVLREVALLWSALHGNGRARSTRGAVQEHRASPGRPRGA